MACGALSGLVGGLYHFDPDSFALAHLRPVDVRAHLARAAGDPALTGTAVVIVITGIPWRTTWRYAERGRLLIVSYCPDTNPAFVVMALRTIDQVLADHALDD